MAVATTEEPILSRLDRLDNILRQMEDIRGSHRSPKSSSYASTPSSGTLTSDGGHVSSVDFSPKSLEKHCRPIHDVIMEIELKGSLIQRLVHVEDRVVKLEEEFEAEKRREEQSAEKKPHEEGLKQMIQSWVKGSKKHKGRTKTVASRGERQRENEEVHVVAI